MRVFISDVNDNKPVFAQRLYEVGVDENADVGLAVVTVSANDEDEGMLDETANLVGEEGGTVRFFQCWFLSVKVKGANQPDPKLKVL